MGTLTQKEILIAYFAQDGFYTAADIRKAIRDAPEFKPYPERKAVLIRDIRRNIVTHVCSKCDHALNKHVLPNTVKYCANCGSRFDAITDNQKIIDR